LAQRFYFLSGSKDAALFQRMINQREVIFMISVLVNGALGRMGREVLKAVSADAELRLTGAVDIAARGEAVSEFIDIESDIRVLPDLAKALRAAQPQVVVDFTRPDAVMGSLRVILREKTRAVVGTTGFSREDLAEAARLAEENSTAVFIAPNFSVGANLMMRLAEEAVKYLPQAEIIELHHDNKLDAPSGTALLTAERMSAARGGRRRQGHPDEKEKIAGARGGDVAGIKIHSVRLPGYVAHQEIILGGQGETLTIRHDSTSRESFMPGVLLACRGIMNRTGLVYGLDKLLG
jgi:4-hydroxy-tetrahydrodipicolinate reductase